jgi:alkylation response protein AidB-like acyl-CoA dehydrogenase
MARPKAFGGLELDPLTMFAVIEEMARHDSAAAWNLQIANGGQVFLAWFPDDTASEVFDSGPGSWRDLFRQDRGLTRWTAATSSKGRHRSSAAPTTPTAS